MKRLGIASALGVIVAVALANAAAALTPAGVQADAIVTVNDKRVVVAPVGLEAGMATFFVVNKGKQRHHVTINGPGLSKVHTHMLAPGKSETLKVRLRVGSYTLYDVAGLRGERACEFRVFPAKLVTGHVSGGTTAGDDVVCGGVIP